MRTYCKIILQLFFELIKHYTTFISVKQHTYTQLVRELYGENKTRKLTKKQHQPYICKGSLTASRFCLYS